MTSAGEVFVVELARASRRANRFLHGLSRADRDDILSAALLWCWEHKNEYPLTTPLENWFVSAVRHAYRDWRQGELGHKAKVMEIPTEDTTSATAEAVEAMDKLLAALTPKDKAVAQMLMQGRTRVEMMRDGLSQRQFHAARQRIRQLRKFIPDDKDYRRLMREKAKPTSDDRYNVSSIDREIYQLEAMPRHGADCPPCWKCKWFEGYLPGAHKRVGMAIQEPEVAAAVAVIEGRKVDIAKRVRAGTINQ